MASTKSVFRLAQATIRPTESVLHRGFLQSTLSRTFHSSRRLLDEKKPGKDEDPVSFRLSLYQSTFDRIQRERADSDRFAKIRRATDTDYIGSVVSFIVRTYIVLAHKQESD